MAIGNRYALWLAPETGAAAVFAAAIGELSEHHGGPRFAPHVTLLGRVRGEERALREQAERFAAEIPRLRLRATGFVGEPYYFRCFYVRLDPSAALRAAHAAAVRAFGTDNPDAYLPHVSLYYGRLGSAEKDAIPGLLNDPLPAEFEVDRLQLVHITANIADWRVVTELALS